MPPSSHNESGKLKNPNADDVFIARKTLSWDTTKNGADALMFDRKRVLTKSGESVSRWTLPDCLRQVNISYHSVEKWKSGYFQSTGRGQEFVFSADGQPDILDWVKGMIEP